MVVCETKFHRSHSKNMKSLIPVRQQIFEIVYLVVKAYQLRRQIDFIRSNRSKLKCFHNLFTKCFKCQAIRCSSAKDLRYKLCKVNALTYGR